MEKNMTALISCYSRCYHYENNKCRIFSDSYARKILTDEEYNSISENMINGINFFNPKFIGTKEEALRWIVDNRLSPSVLGRSTFTEKSLMNAIRLGCRQYLIFASGYDTFAYRNNIKDLKIFEIDKKEMIEDKKKRVPNVANYIECDFTKSNWTNNILNSSYDKNIISFSSLLGISYYLTKQEFSNMIKDISEIVSENSSIVFDYPVKQNKELEKLAKGANEEMKSTYSYNDIEELLSDNGFLIYEHLDDKEMTNNYFEIYNTFNPNNRIYAPENVNYCLAIKKSMIK